MKGVLAAAGGCNKDALHGCDAMSAAQAGGVGAVAAPWIVYLGQKTGASFVPFVIFGSLNIVAGVATPALPETLGAPAAATVQVTTQLHSKKHRGLERTVVPALSVKCQNFGDWEVCLAALLALGRAESCSWAIYACVMTLPQHQRKGLWVSRS